AAALHSASGRVAGSAVEAAKPRASQEIQPDKVQGAGRRNGEAIRVNPQPKFSSRRLAPGSSGTELRIRAGAERRRQAGVEEGVGAGGRGKAAGVAIGEPATGSDPGGWSCSDDESPEASVSADGLRQRKWRQPAGRRLVVGQVTRVT